MGKTFYRGYATYLIYGEESVYGTGAVSASNKITKIQTATWTCVNNFIRNQGLGDGRNATSAVTGAFDVSGNVDGFIDDPSWLQYVIGKRQGAGTSADPYELVELENIGYGATDIKSLTLEAGSEGGTDDDATQISGVVFNSSTITLSQGELLGFTADWTGRSVNSTTSLAAYTGSVIKPFVFHSGNVSIGSEAFNCLSADVTIANSMNTWRNVGSRFIDQPVTGLRRYDFNLTFKLNKDDTASTLSGVELRDYFYGQANNPSTNPNLTSYAFDVTVQEGAGAGNRVFQISLENAFFENWSNPVALEGAPVEVSVSGFALSGETDSTDKIPIRWWTI